MYFQPVCMHMHMYMTCVPSHLQLVWIETPTNPTLRVVDIKAVTDLAHKKVASALCYMYILCHMCVTCVSHVCHMTLTQPSPLSRVVWFVWTTLSCLHIFR